MTKEQSAPLVPSIEFGIDTFGDLPMDEKGKLLTYAGAIRQVVKEGELADTLGIDYIGLGEHHREEYSISSPEVILAAIAARTKRIKMNTAVTVLSSDDPVRLFERFATLDALSNGRTQVILGRGSFTESFPLFGYDLRDYNELFEEKIGLFAELLNETPVTWSGNTRASLENADIFPKTESGHLNVAVGVGGSPESVIRTARYGFQMVLAIIGGAPARFKPYVELYRKATEELGTEQFPIGIHSPGYVADTDAEAINYAWKNYKIMWDAVGKTRGWPPYTKQQFDYEVEFGSLYVGSPETVANKIARAIRTLDAERFDMMYGGGHVSVEQREKMITLYATKVIPRVRELLSDPGFGKDSE